MFTGLIEELGNIRTLTVSTVSRLRVAAKKLSGEVNLGDSVSVNGVCLTVTAAGGGELTFDAVPETISRSSLMHLKVGDAVNLESSIRAGEPMGGHFVLGHVDGTVRVTEISTLGDSKVFKFSSEVALMRYVVEKGSVAVDGISLTVASCFGDGFTVAVIPHTLNSTNLAVKRVGDILNLETDILGKYVEKFTVDRRGGVTFDKLRDAGFM